MIGLLDIVGWLLLWLVVKRTVFPRLRAGTISVALAAAFVGATWAVFPLLFRLTGAANWSWGTVGFSGFILFVSAAVTTLVLGPRLLAHTRDRP